MKHRLNTALDPTVGRMNGSDPLTDFRQSVARTIRGLRVKQIDDVHLSNEIREAILYGPTVKPMDAGDYAQVQTIGAQRGLKEQEPHIFHKFRIEFNAVNLRRLIYRPDRPEQLHRLHVSVDTNSRIYLGRVDGAALNDDDDGIFGGEMNVGSGPIQADFGKIGVLLTPANALFGDSTTINHIVIALQLSTAQLG